MIEKYPPDPATNTPFVIYESGTPHWIANTILDSAKSTIEIFEKLPADNAFAELRARTRMIPHRLQDADAAAVRMTYLELFLRREGDDTPLLTARLDMLKCMIQSPPEKAWESLREYILNRVDDLSGWNAAGRHRQGADDCHRPQALQGRGRDHGAEGRLRGQS